MDATLASNVKRKGLSDSEHKVRETDAKIDREGFSA
jgi:hypothetical protein